MADVLAARSAVGSAVFGCTESPPDVIPILYAIFRRTTDTL